MLGGGKRNVGGKLTNLSLRFESRNLMSRSGICQ
jgi:hypothetical protein